MIKSKHFFHENTSISGNGTDFKMINQSTDSILVISCGKSEDSSATSAKLSFYGKSFAGDEFISIKAIKASDYSTTNEGTINESYLIDCSSYEEVRVALSNVEGGNVSVIGTLIKA